MNIDKGDPYWTNTPSAKGYNIREDTLLEQIWFLVDNNHIKVNNITLRRTIGIPMGTDCAPLLANLFLKSDFPPAKTFGNTLVDT